MKWIVRICRFGLALLFLFTAGAKLAVVRAFASNVTELLNASGVKGERWSWSTTIAIILIEVVVAVLLLLPRTVRLGALAAAILLLGIIASQLGVKTALRNVALVIPAIVVWFGARRSYSRSYKVAPALPEQS